MEFFLTMMMVSLLLPTLQEFEHGGGEDGSDLCLPLPTLLPVGSAGLLSADAEVVSEPCHPYPACSMLAVMVCSLPHFLHSPSSMSLAIPDMSPTVSFLLVRKVSS